MAQEICLTYTANEISQWLIRVICL